MKKLIFLLVLLSFNAGAAEVERVTRGNLAIEGIPEIPPELVQRMRRYQFARSAFFAGWTPDGRITISTRFGNTSQMHIVDKPMGARRQITFFDEPIYGGELVADRRAQGHRLHPRRGRRRELPARVPRSRESRTRCGSPTGAAARARASGRRTARSTPSSGRCGPASTTDVYIDDPLDRMRARDGVRGAGSRLGRRPTGRRTGSRCCSIRFVSVNESYSEVYDLATREKREIEPAKVKAARGGGDFLDATARAYTSRPISAASSGRCATWTSRRGKVTPLTDHIKWDMDDLALSRDGRYLAYVVNEDGASRLGVMDLVQHADLIPPKLPFGVIGSIDFDPAGKRLAFSLQTPAQPYDVWVSDARGRRTRALDARARSARSTRRGSSRRRSCISRLSTRSDGKPRQIPAWVYKPAGAGPHPVLISIHGGPESQTQPAFSISTQQWAVELGYAVIHPNVRGSTGYGKTYVALDNGMKREDSVKDIGALLDWIATQPDLDSKRIVVIGGSYGGYMVLASMTHYNDRLRGAIDIVGISNFVTFLESTAEYRRDLRRPEYGDERDPKMREFLQKISPLNNVGKINKPMLDRAGPERPARAGTRKRSRWSRRSARTAARSGTSSGSTRATASPSATTSTTTSGRWRCSWRS